MQIHAAAKKRISVNRKTNIHLLKKVIGVVSGKGGVGKSLVTASLARMMREKRIYSRNFRCGYYRSVYSENVRNT